MTICHHVLAKFLTDPLLSCLMKKKDEVTVRKRIFPNRLGEGILISSWGYKALCFIQKPLTPVDFFISILKIGQCPWSRISSNKLLPCSQQWKQIISLFFFSPTTELWYNSREGSFVHLSSRLYSSLIAKAHSYGRRDKSLSTLWVECQRLNVYKKKLKGRLENNFLLGMMIA